eukprot:6144524-Prymnesium_polylepis.3
MMKRATSVAHPGGNVTQGQGIHRGVNREKMGGVRDGHGKHASRPESSKLNAQSKTNAQDRAQNALHAQAGALRRGGRPVAAAVAAALRHPAEPFVAPPLSERAGAPSAEPILALPHSSLHAVLHRSRRFAAASSSYRAPGVPPQRGAGRHLGPGSAAFAAAAPLAAAAARRPCGAVDPLPAAAAARRAARGAQDAHDDADALDVARPSEPELQRL